MKPANSRMISLLLLSFIFSLPSPGQEKATEEAGVKACLENYMSGEGDKVEKAFHPSATMKYIDAQSGEFKDVPIADYIARVKANTTKMERKIGIESLNIEGNAAQAKDKDRDRQIDPLRLHESFKNKRRVEDRQ